MYYYFSSAYPAAIKFDGIYYGVVSNTVKSIKIEGAPPLVEICPLVPSERQINFIPDRDFLCSPPDGILVTDLRGGFLIKTRKNPIASEFRVLCQQKFSDAVVTVFTDNGLKVSMETRNGFFSDSSDFSANAAEIKRFSLNSAEFFAVYLSGEENLLACYSFSGKIKKVFSRNVSDYSTDGGFYTTEKFQNIAKHTVRSEWEFSDDEFRQKNKSVERSEKFVASELPDKILPYAFLEEICVGGNPADFLSENLKENADMLKGYLGEFIGVIPPPHFRSINEIGLIFPDGKNKYKAEYCTFEISDKKILNIIKTG